MRAHHKFRKIRSFLHQKVRTSTFEEAPSPLVRIAQTPLHLTAEDFYGQSLGIILYCKNTGFKLA